MSEKMIEKYVSGKSTEKERIEVALWAGQDEKNQAEIVNASKMFVMSLVADMPSVAQTRRRKFFGTIARYACYCAALAAFFAAGYIIRQISLKDHYTLTAVAVNVPHGQRSQLTLSDGTEVWLNANSTLEVMEEQGLRKVRLCGEALFDVTKDAEHPFIVQTQRAYVKVLGTKFNVSSYKDNNLSIKLFDGSVNVIDSESGEVINLQPSEMVVYDGNSYVRSEIDNNLRRFWIDGYYSFEEASYREIIGSICKYLGYQAVIESDDINSLTCSCTFRIEDGIEHLLEVLNIIHPFPYSIDKTNKIITIK